jgi:uncharacterized protein YjdB
MLMKATGVLLTVGLFGVACSSVEPPKADTTTPPISCVLRGLTVSPATVTVHIGDTLRVAASYNDCPGPQRTHSFRWSSSNATIASVDSIGGLITARGEGVATIIAELADDRTQKGAMLLQVAR